MRIFVIIATKGRPNETYNLLHSLQQQTRQPELTLVVGTNQGDIEGLKEHPFVELGRAEAHISPKVGLTAQRNFALNWLAQKGQFNVEEGDFFCAFFDDDFRMAPDWIERANERFRNGGIVGLTGCVLADGVKTEAITEAGAYNYITGKIPPQEHWASGTKERDIDSVYGCNMAFAGHIIRNTRFDETLPLYGWQEDRDYTGMAKKIGRVIYYPACKGVHLGVKAGRVSGLKFGYSQIANPMYLMKKGTMDSGTGWRFIGRALLANMMRSSSKNYPLVDYHGRMQGNWRALKDLLLMRLHPGNLPQ